MSTTLFIEKSETTKEVNFLHLCTVDTIVFRLVLAKFRPNSDKKNTEIQTKFRLLLTIFKRYSNLQRQVHLMLM